MRFSFPPSGRRRGPTFPATARWNSFPPGPPDGLQFSVANAVSPGLVAKSTTCVPRPLNAHCPGESISHSNVCLPLIDTANLGGRFAGAAAATVAASNASTVNARRPRKLSTPVPMIARGRRPINSAAACRSRGSARPAQLFARVSASSGRRPQASARPLPAAVPLPGDELGERRLQRIGNSFRRRNGGGVPSALELAQVLRVHTRDPARDLLEWVGPRRGRAQAPALTRRHDWRSTDRAVGDRRTSA